MAEKAPRSQRQALVGTASPRWLPGTDVLELPVLGDDRFVRLVRPRTQEILWATMVEAQAGSYAPYVFAADGRYDGADAAVAENLGREGAPKITAPMRRAVGLVRLFLSERPAANPGKCRGERLHELRQQPMNAPGK